MLTLLGFGLGDASSLTARSKGVLTISSSMLLFEASL
jgi:hypothetical protein